MVRRYQYTNDPVADAEAHMGDEAPCEDCGGTGVEQDCHEDDARFDSLRDDDNDRRYDRMVEEGRR